MSDADALPPTERLDSDDIVTVTQLNSEIAELVASTATIQHEYVTGDISECHDANGHLHFDLVHDGASIHCVLFAFRRGGVATEPEPDMQVAVRGDLNYYEPRGECSIAVTEVVALGEGAYSQVYEENRATLEADGLLADERKQELPELPSCVGVVTSADSDARTDAVTAIHDRYPDVNVNVYDATVQGPQALEELLAGISALDENTAVDVIIVTRGGGADKTLRVFNELPLCRVIANTETPVVVGVGHENDRTLADEVADHRVMTPTHAGDIVPRKQDLQEDISQHGERLAAAYQGAVETRLAAFATALDNAYDQMVTSSLQRFESRLETAATRHIETELADLETQLNAAYRDVERKREHEQKLAETRATAETEISTMRRRYRLAILTLLGVLLTLVVILLLQV